jgi:hypothetical protein
MEESNMQLKGWRNEIKFEEFEGTMEELGIQLC